MCGIAGIINYSEKKIDFSSILKKMTNAINHRGPDGEGFWSDKNIYFGHKRLSILDLTNRGSQPMVSSCGQYIINYNGEIYNFKELKKKLISKGYSFKSDTDTEVVLYSLIAWGSSALNMFNGMFAFAFYDRKKKNLLLARDRYGIKPLYLYKNNLNLYFASEQKAFFELDSYKKEFNYNSLSQYFVFQNIFSNETLFRDIVLMPAGCYLEVNKRNVNELFNFRKYWDFDFVSDNKLKENECIEHINFLLKNSVQKQLVADVEVGTYLSGGIDSGLINFIASESKKIKSFTCGFDLSSASGIEMTFDERKKAEYISYKCKSEHYQMVLKAGDMQDSLSLLCKCLDEPRMGQSYPNYHIAKLTSKFTKVVLSGIGGDEIFGGYPWRYFFGNSKNNFKDYINSYFKYWQKMTPLNELETLFLPISNKINIQNIKFEFERIFEKFKDKKMNFEDFFNASLYFESKTFLHGLLNIEDKISMSHSIETRLPYLDNDLVDFSLTVPAKFKIQNLRKKIFINENAQINKREKYFERSREGKNILRKIMKKYYSKEIFKIPKQGFSSPDASWFKGESIDFVKNNLIKNRKLPVYDFLNYNYVKNKIMRHISGKENNRLFIWSVLSINEVLKN